MMASSGVETEIRALGTRFVAIFRSAGVKLVENVRTRNLPRVWPNAAKPPVALPDLIPMAGAHP